MRTIWTTLGSTCRARIFHDGTPNAFAAVTKSVAAVFIVSARRRRANPAQLVTPMMTAKRKSRRSARSNPVS